MSRFRPCRLVFGLCLWSKVVLAQPSSPSSSVLELNLNQAIALARKQAPELNIARARVLEHRARVHEADVPRFSPQLTTRLGPRWQGDGVALDWSIRAQHWLELGRERRSRVDVARAGVRTSEARKNSQVQQRLHEVSLAFVRVVYWHHRAAIAEDNLAIAISTRALTDRKQSLGAAGGLDQTLAQLHVTRSRAQRDRVRAAIMAAEARFFELVGLPGDTQLRATQGLATLAHGDGTNGTVRPRPDIAAARAELQQAEHEAELARRGRAPNLALGIGYGREGDEHVLLGSLTFSLPHFARQRGQLRVAQSKQKRLRTEIETLRYRTELRQRSTLARLGQLNTAAEQFEHQGLPQLERATSLAETSYRSGAMTLGELLNIRRDLNLARLEYAELLLETATARRELAAERGAF